MAVNVVSYGGMTLVDLRDATAKAPQVMAGYTAYGADGQKITGTGPEVLRRDISLPLSGWTDAQQTVGADGVTADSMVIVTVDRWGVQCVAQGAGTLTFAYEVRPTGTVTAHVAILNNL